MWQFLPHKGRYPPPFPGVDGVMSEKPASGVLYIYLPVGNGKGIFMEMEHGYGNGNAKDSFQL